MRVTELSVPPRVSVISLKPTHLIGAYAQLSFGFN